MCRFILCSVGLFPIVVTDAVVYCTCTVKPPKIIKGSDFAQFFHPEGKEGDISTCIMSSYIYPIKHSSMATSVKLVGTLNNNFYLSQFSLS
jgi:hypothetical protein